MPLPAGLPIKTLTFGRYTTALGTNQGGEVEVGFQEAMLHVPTGEVITGGLEKVKIDAATGRLQINVPVTVTDDLVAQWRETSAYVNQRVLVKVTAGGYTTDYVFVDIHPADPAIIDFDQFARYPSPGGVPISRAAVASLAGMTGDITAAAAAAALQPFIATGTLTSGQLADLVDTVQQQMAPTTTLVTLFENGLL